MAARQRYETPSTAEGQRSCARGPWCAAQTRDDEGAWHPALTYAPFCPADTSKIAQDAEALPAAYDRLAASVGDPPRHGRAVRVSPGSRVLVSAEADALLRELADITGGWAARVRDVPGHPLGRHPSHPHGTPERVAADCAALACQNAVPLLALPAAPMSRTWTWRPGSPMPADLAADLADLEILHIGDGWVRALTRLSGEHAGLDILDLHRRAARHLGETPAPLEWLDGIQCRKCDAYALFRAPLPAGPEDPRDPSPFSECAECRDRMTAEEYGEWVKLNDAHARHSPGITCRRCLQGRHGECRWKQCSCAGGGHAAALRPAVTGGL